MAGIMIGYLGSLGVFSLYLFIRVREQVGVIEYQMEQIGTMEEDLQLTRDRLFDQVHGNTILEARLHQLEMQAEERE